MVPQALIEHMFGQNEPQLCGVFNSLLIYEATVYYGVKLGK